MGGLCGSMFLCGLCGKKTCSLCYKTPHIKVYVLKKRAHFFSLTNTNAGGKLIATKFTSTFPKTPSYNFLVKRE